MDFTEQLIAYLTVIVGVCSVIAALLPSPDAFDKYPRFRAVYEVIYIFVETIALNKLKVFQKKAVDPPQEPKP